MLVGHEKSRLQNVLHEIWNECPVKGDQQTCAIATLAKDAEFLQPRNKGVLEIFVYGQEGFWKV